MAETKQAREGARQRRWRRWKRWKEVVVARFDVCWQIAAVDWKMGPAPGTPFIAVRPSTFNPRPVKLTFQRLAALRPLCTLIAFDIATLFIAAVIYGAEETSRVSRAMDRHHCQPIDMAYHSLAAVIDMRNHS